MSQIKLRFIEPLIGIDEIPGMVSNGDTIPVAVSKLQTQILNNGGPTQLLIDGGSANTTFTQYLVRFDFGKDGATINPTGNPTP